ncbi:hypothetical protein HPP92_007587 [Vanilla planifolia]|uniref:Potassium channel n=1 Tax=Vanilla planifolia TaxID=51239 RepID=A0A835RGP8_VANPL|nr:hypothetical protein HPP92_007587 [Vanilla planifolia]
MEGEGKVKFGKNKAEDSIQESFSGGFVSLLREHELDAPRITEAGYRTAFIHPNDRWYRLWISFVLLWCIYSVIFTPLEFGFFRGLPAPFTAIDGVISAIFIVDILLRFFVSYRDARTQRMVYSRSSIALRYMKGGFILDLLGCLPWDSLYKSTGRNEILRYLLWIRLYRLKRIKAFFKQMEKDIRINYLSARIAKLVSVQLYSVHTAACIIYYLATTMPPEEEDYTWIGSLKLGDYSYVDFRDIEFFKRYVTSLYFISITMATIGYGDIHAVNTREMAFSHTTEKFREEMTNLTQYIKRHNLGHEITNQIKSHLRLQYECNPSRKAFLDGIPETVKARLYQYLYFEIVQEVPLFKGCSEKFLNQIVMKLKEDFFLPGEVVLEQGAVVDHIYIISHGLLEEVLTGENRAEKPISELEPYDLFGEVAALCNIRQPYTVRACKLCRLLLIEKQCLSSILQLYVEDSSQILSNLNEGREANPGKKQLVSNISYLISKREAELAMGVRSAAHHGDTKHLKDLIDAGADPNQTDFDGRTTLHIAASRGYDDVVMLLIQQNVNVNCIDRFGNSPLLEAVKAGHDEVANLLKANGANLNLEDAGTYLCKLAVENKVDILRRMLEHGVDPNCKNFDHRTPLHVAAAEGLHLVAAVFIEFGADVFAADRWGNTPFDEGHRCGSKLLMDILKHARKAKCSG